jgi:hypothetical protein
MNSKTKDSYEPTPIIPFIIIFLVVIIITYMLCRIGIARSAEVETFLAPKDFYTISDFPNSKEEVIKFCKLSIADAAQPDIRPCSKDNWEILCKNMTGKLFIGYATTQDVEMEHTKGIITAQKLLFRHINQGAWTNYKQTPFGISIKFLLKTADTKILCAINDGIPREPRYRKISKMREKDTKSNEIINIPGAYIRNGTLLSFSGKVINAIVVDGEECHHVISPYEFICNRNGKIQHDAKEILFDFSKPLSERVKLNQLARQQNEKLFRSDLSIVISIEMEKVVWSNKPNQSSNLYLEPAYPDISHWILNEEVRIKRQKAMPIK